MASELLRVLIVGCGNMAGGYDLRQPEDAPPLGHAKAFSKHGGFSLAACVEPDEPRRRAFQERWQVQIGFASLKDVAEGAGHFDVISICSPTSTHADDLQTALKLGPRLVFCEKPVTSNFQDTQRLVQVCSEQKVLLAVNYSRRWSPEVAQLKADLSNGDWGAVRSVSAMYNKGILNNGSHMIDLLLCLFGPLRLTNVGQAVNDFFEDDPTVDATLVTGQRVPVQLNVAHAQDYAVFEMQIVTERGVISMEDGGARWRFRRAEDSTQLPGYRFLNQGEWTQAKGSLALSRAVKNIFGALQSGEVLSSTGSSALQAQALCEQIKKMALAQPAGQTQTGAVL
jgi:predicted dehydrogenase